MAIQERLEKHPMFARISIVDVQTGRVPGVARVSGWTKQFAYWTGTGFEVELPAGRTACSNPIYVARNGDAIFEDEANAALIFAGLNKEKRILWPPQE